MREAMVSFWEGWLLVVGVALGLGLEVWLPGGWFPCLIVVLLLLVDHCRNVSRLFEGWKMMLQILRRW